MVRVPTLPQRVLAHIREQGLLRPGDRVGVAVSGGADSVALLRLLLELRQDIGVVLSVVHFNHLLRGAESDGDAQFVAELASHHKLALSNEAGDVARHAKQARLSLEAAARHLRYEYFTRLLREKALDRIVTAHTLDDQAETVLLRIARGAGTRGLAGIHPTLAVADSQAAIVRPLLTTRRCELEAYLHELSQTWREDSSNRDLQHTRNRVRQIVLPALSKELNPSIREALAETAEIARAEEKYWEDELERLLPDLQADDSSLKTAPLLALQLALQRRVVRAVAESLGLRLEFKHVEEILRVAGGLAAASALPEGWTVRASHSVLHFEHPSALPVRDYEYPLPVPGSVDVPELGSRIEVISAPAGYNPQNLLDPAALGELKVRNWRAGDRYWPAHTSRARKLKELLQEKHVSGLERKLWPVVANGAEIVWVRGFHPPAHLRPREANQPAVVIRELEP